MGQVSLCNVFVALKIGKERIDIMVVQLGVFGMAFVAASLLVLNLVHMTHLI